MKFLTFVLVLTLTSAAFATDDSVVNDPFKKSSSEPTPKFDPISPAAAFARAQAVLEYFGVPAEQSNDDLTPLFERQPSIDEMTRVLRILDSNNQFFRFARVENGVLTSYLDRDGYKEADFSVTLADDNSMPYLSPAIVNIRNARLNPTNQPLLGLRIACDPGHMSALEWEKLTGKYVKDRQGNTISEGLINLQTCLVLKAEFEALGAIVKVTREDHNPVSSLPLRSLDLQAYGRNALREKSLDGWFQALLANNVAGPALYRSFETNAKFQALFKESARANYFILREDLEARIDVIEDFQADISLIIHYDSQDPPTNPNGVNTKNYSRVKTYVHGSASPEEWAMNGDRRFFFLHALDTTSSDASFNLAKSVVNAMSKGLGLKYDQGGGGTSVAVAPGVFSRNLFITKKAYGHAHTYVECLHYNDPTEFRAMLRKDFMVEVEGRPTYYSSRLRDVAWSIRDGVLEFVRGTSSIARN